jgi:hypothetical protein
MVSGSDYGLITFKGEGNPKQGRFGAYGLGRSLEHRRVF